MHPAEPISKLTSCKQSNVHCMSEHYILALKHSSNCHAICQSCYLSASLRKELLTISVKTINIGLPAV